MDIKCVLFTGVDQVETSTTGIPDTLADGQVLVRTLFTGISPGTELRVLAGRQPKMPEFPLIPGYQNVGVVEKVQGDSTLAVGQHVFVTGREAPSHRTLWGAHAAYSITDASRCIPLPDGADAKQVALAKLTAIALRGVDRVKPNPGEEVAIVGLGILGQIATRLFRERGHRVVVGDINEKRVRVAESAGAEGVLLGRDDMVERFAEKQPDGAGIVIDATGHPAIPELAVKLAKPLPWHDEVMPNARLLIQGSPSELRVDYHAAFMPEIDIVFTRDNSARNLNEAVAKIASGDLNLTELFEVRPCAEAPAAYARLKEPDALPMSFVFDWS